MANIDGPCNSVEDILELTLFTNKGRGSYCLVKDRKIDAVVKR